MPRRQQHIESSAAATAIFACLADLAIQDGHQRADPLYRVDLGRTVTLAAGAYAIGGAAGAFPDILEPATTPRHREFFHSWTTLGLLTWGTYQLLQSPLNPALKWLGGVVATGYVVHLIDDATEHDRSRLPVF